MCLEKHTQQSVVQPAQYDPTTARKPPKTTSIFMPKDNLENRALSLLYGLYGSEQYDPTTKNKDSTQAEKFPWDLCPIYLGKCAHQATHFPLSSFF
jgi:hypothetical protein